MLVSRLLAQDEEVDEEMSELNLAVNKQKEEENMQAASTKVN